MRYAGILMGIWLVVSGPASAAFLIPSGAVETYQEWYFTTSQNPAAPEVDDNPIGDFPALTAQIGGAAFFPNLRWENGVWKDTALTVTIDVPNNEVPNPYKVVTVQMMVQGDIVLSWVRDGQGNDFERLSRLIEPSGTENDPWFLVTDQWRIEPNPMFERFCYGLNGFDGGDAAIDWVKIRTLCVPEPASLGLLLAGGGWMMRRKRRA